MNCERSNELMILDLYGEASAAESAELKEHLAGCAECRRVAEVSRGLLEEFRAEPTPRPSRETIDAVLESAQPRPGLREIFFRLRPALWQAAAVVVIALVASVAIKFWPHAPTPALVAQTQPAETETAWESSTSNLSERIHVASADASFDSSLDYRITSLRDAVAQYRSDSERF